LFVLAAVLTLGRFVSPVRDANNAGAERYIIESERQWAEAVSSGDTSIVEKILADDYLGMDPDGGLYDKSTAISFTREGPKEFVSNHLNSVKVFRRPGGGPREASLGWVDGCSHERPFRTDGYLDPANWQMADRGRGGLIAPESVK
jgi:hypothetical protein